jgi:hypothetical protein
MGEMADPAIKMRFDRRVRLEFRGATITSDAGLLAVRPRPTSTSRPCYMGLLSARSETKLRSNRGQ